MTLPKPAQSVAAGRPPHQCQRGGGARASSRVACAAAQERLPILERLEIAKEAGGASDVIGITVSDAV